jgi:hypothetical protein
VDKTNILLKRAGMLDKLDSTQKMRLQKGIGIVDSHRRTFEAVVEIDVFISIIIERFGGKQGRTLTMTLNNGTDDLFGAMDQGLTSSTDDLVEEV